MTSFSPQVLGRGVVDQVTNDDKENNPFLLENKVNKVQEPHEHPSRRRRHLSLIDANTITRGSISASEFGGVSSVNEGVTVGRNRWGSMVDSLKKNRKTTENIKEEHALGNKVIPVDISSYGLDWNNLIDEMNVKDSPRPRYATAVESLRKESIEESLICNEEISDVFSETDDIFETPDVFKKLQVKTENQQKIFPNDVVNIDDEDCDLLEYSQEIIQYLRKLEVSFTLPLDFLEHGSVSPSMRSTLVDWLIQVQHHLNLCQETLYLTVSMLDLVLDRRDVDPDKLQLVGITAMLVASKLEEYYPAEIKKLLHLTENSYTLRDVLEMELVLVDVLDFQLYIPSPQVFLQRYTAASLHPSSSIFLATCHYLIDSHLPSLSHPSTPPSLLSAAATLASGLVFLITTSTSPPLPSIVWTPTLRYYSGYGVEDLVLVSISMLNMILSSVYTGANVKYRSKSRHDRLVMKDHLQREVVVRAVGVLEGWSSSFDS